MVIKEPKEKTRPENIALGSKNEGRKENPTKLEGTRKRGRLCGLGAGGLKRENRMYALKEKNGV